MDDWGGCTGDGAGLGCGWVFWVVACCIESLFLIVLVLAVVPPLTVLLVKYGMVALWGALA